MSIELRSVSHWTKAKTPHDSVGDENCVGLLDACAWQLRCFHAEEQAKVLEQYQLVDAHPRWPSSTGAVEILQQSCDALESNIGKAEASIAQAVQSRANLLESFSKCTSELCECWRDRNRLIEVEQTKLADSRNAASGNFVCKLDSKRDVPVADKEYEIMLAATLSECELLGSFLECESPGVRQLESELAAASREAEHARVIALKRDEKVARQAEEVELRIRQAEEEHCTVQRQLCECQAQLAATIQSATGTAEEMQQARATHGQQVKLVRQGTFKLRGDLAGSFSEHEEYSEYVESATIKVSSLENAHLELQIREHEAHHWNAVVNQEVSIAAEQLSALNDESSAMSTTCKTFETRLEENEEAFKQSRGKALVAQHEGEAAESSLTALHLKLEEQSEELGPSAAARRAEAMSTCRAELERLKEEGEEVTEASEKLRINAQVRQQHREHQFVVRHAMSEAAMKLKASYAEFIRDVKVGKTRTLADVTAVSNRSIRRIGKYVDDYLKYAEMASGRTDDAGDRGCAEDDVPWEMRVPEVLTQAFAAVHEQSAFGQSRAEIIQVERQKAHTLRAKTREDNAEHAADCDRLSQQSEWLRGELKQCDVEMQTEREHTAEACCALESHLQNASLQETRVQADAFTLVQEELRMHAQELARLRSERGELQTRRSRETERARAATSCGTGIDALSKSDEITNLAMQLKQKHNEVTDICRRIAAGRKCYDELVSELGGHEVVADAGIALQLMTAPTTFAALRVQLSTPSSPGHQAEVSQDHHSEPTPLVDRSGKAIARAEPPTSAVASQKYEVTSSKSNAGRAESSQSLWPSSSSCPRQPSVMDAAGLAAAAVAGISNKNGSIIDKAAAAMAASAAAIAATASPSTPGNTQKVVAAATAAVAAAIQTVRSPRKCFKGKGRSPEREHDLLFSTGGDGSPGSLCDPDEGDASPVALAAVEAAEALVKELAAFEDYSDTGGASASRSMSSGGVDGSMRSGEELEKTVDIMDVPGSKEAGLLQVSQTPLCQSLSKPAGWAWVDLEPSFSVAASATAPSTSPAVELPCDTFPHFDSTLSNAADGLRPWAKLLDNQDPLKMPSAARPSSCSPPYATHADHEVRGESVAFESEDFATRAGETAAVETGGMVSGISSYTTLPSQQLLNLSVHLPHATSAPTGDVPSQNVSNSSFSSLHSPGHNSMSVGATCSPLFYPTAASPAATKSGRHGLLDGRIAWTAISHAHSGAAPVGKDETDGDLHCVAKAQRPATSHLAGLCPTYRDFAERPLSPLRPLPGLYNIAELPLQAYEVGESIPPTVEASRPVSWTPSQHASQASPRTIGNARHPQAAGKQPRVAGRL